ncbi:hypothetical protein CROQUDRAFT_87421 [Cronartium quercuum f. sp. fusiforme G11]|uniref:Uncharacterized protein n=1 Tax=Cronartium quercuum f. sp. fusiforme G11 TaxID=708437 RepID=A0A9P6NWT6_9BASI|nr:hypothetical protein CROQUDRAFT_87421 [Cronartium quercuum f. sp. fusiforme G11]
MPPPPSTVRHPYPHPAHLRLPSSSPVLPIPSPTRPLSKNSTVKKLGGNIGAKIVETDCLPLCQNTNTSPMQLSSILVIMTTSLKTDEYRTHHIKTDEYRTHKSRTSASTLRHHDDED